MNLFVDSDGVIADFEKYFLDYFGYTHNSVSDEEMWKAINAHEDFFGSLPLMKNAEKFLMQAHETPFFDALFILTACPKTNYFVAAIQKKNFYLRKFPELELHVLPMQGGKNKGLFMQSPGDILIDDFKSNIKHWRNLGGYGVVHKNFYETALEINYIVDRTVFDPYDFL
jgi:hypothetical protein